MCFPKAFSLSPVEEAKYFRRLVLEIQTARPPQALQVAAESETSPFNKPPCARFCRCNEAVLEEPRQLCNQMLLMLRGSTATTVHVVQSVLPGLSLETKSPTCVTLLCAAIMVCVYIQVLFRAVCFVIWQCFR